MNNLYELDNNLDNDLDNNDLDNDDQPVGRILSRREVLALMGVTGVSLLASCQPIALTPTAGETATPVAATPVAEIAAESVVPGCVVRPDLTEGPYFVDEQLERSDIRVESSDGSVKEGTRLTLAFLVSQIANGTCTPLPGATVDVWHCDAQGVYSGVSDPGFDTSGQMWLRGYQVTNENGRAEFVTIYPGWYSGRCVHIHFKIRTTGLDNQSYEFTSQLFFDEALTDQVHAQEPYAAKGQRDTLNSTDNIYQDGGDQLLLNLSEAGGAYTATFDIALDLSDTEAGAADGGGGPGGQPPSGTPPPREGG
jgi:protocatechuate 3,4-dioxygenase beta subunit